MSEGKEGVMRGQDRSRSGAVLIVMVLVVIALVGLGLAAISISTGSMLSRVAVSDAARAYYLAESGVEYVKAMRLLQEGVLPSGTFTVSGGDQFELSTVDVTNGIRVVSRGIVNPGSFLETRRQITFVVFNPWLGDEIPVGFDFDMDNEFDEDTWTLVGLKKATIADTGPSGGEPALDLMGTVGRIDLKWQDNPDLDLVSAWQNNGYLLDYEVQMKISPFDTGSEQAYSHHYMLGLSFRLYPDTNTSYGVSFFRSRTQTKNGNPDAAPDWLPAELEPLRGTNVYLILWYQDHESFDLINYKVLDDSTPIVYLDDGNYEIKDYSTMLLHLKESFNESGVRENNIVLYTQSPDVYPNWSSRDDVRWREDVDVFPSALLWDNPAVTNHTDTRITSQHFSLTRPSEIAVHVYYDLQGANKKFFDDFAMRMEGYENPLSGGSGQIQY